MLSRSKAETQADYSALPVIISHQWIIDPTKQTQYRVQQETPMKEAKAKIFEEYLRALSSEWTPLMADPRTGKTYNW